MLPPMVDTRWLAGSGAKKRPCCRATTLTSRFGTPGSTTATRATGSISWIVRSRAVAMTTASPQAIVPPERPVPAPRGTMAAPARRAARTHAAICCVSAGTATASGGRLSNPASYSKTIVSSARQKTFASPQIALSSRASVLGPTAAALGVIFDPDRAVFGELLLPDRDHGLQLIDAFARRGERRIAVRRTGRDDDRDLSDRQIPDAVVHHDARRGILRLEPVRDLAHLPLGHLGVGLVLEVRHPLPSTAVAYRAQEHDDAAERRVAHGPERVVHRQSRRRHHDRRGAHRAAGHRWDERDLVAVGQRLVRGDVFTVPCDHDRPTLGDERMPAH